MMVEYDSLKGFSDETKGVCSVDSVAKRSDYRMHDQSGNRNVLIDPLREYSSIGLPSQRRPQTEPLL